MKKFVSLLSGGLDSPIAAYLMIKKKYNPIFLSFLTSDDLEHSMKEKIIKIVNLLTQFTEDQIKLYLINHDPNLEVIKSRCERKLTCVLCKRMMIRTAMKICKNENTNLIVTGDILGEQASQTLDNLFSYNNILNDYIILRPLIGWDKIDVIKLNEKIGLYETTSKSSAGCQFNPQYPETHAKPNQVHDAELNFNPQNIIDNSIRSAEILYI